MVHILWLGQGGSKIWERKGEYWWLVVGIVGTNKMCLFLRTQ